MITRLVALRVHPERQDQLAEILASSAPRVRAVPGCQSLTIVQDISDPLHYLTWSQWDSLADLEAYRHGPVYAEVWPRIRACLAERAHAHTFEVAVDL